MWVFRGFFLLKFAELTTTVELVSGDDTKCDRRWQERAF